MEIFKNIMFVLLGIVIAFVVTCAVIGIASAVNDISFGQQIVEWFGSAGNSETVEEVTDVVASKLIMK